MKSSLVTRNIRIHDRRTSVRLEPQLWRALELIAEREGSDLNAICSKVADIPRDDGGFTSALRVFIISYFADIAFGGQAALEEGEPKRIDAGRRLDQRYA